jgi:ribonuclease M5
MVNNPYKEVENMKIKEVIVVEGKDDERAIKKAVDAEVITTSGWGLNDKIIEKISGAYKRTGIIIFTDPDHAGEKIRERLSRLFPDAKHCYLPREDARSGDNIGIENGSSENIIKALSKVRTVAIEKEDEFSMSDLTSNKLVGMDGSTQRRDRLGAILGIGYCNGKRFLKRLNYFGISREEFESGICEMEAEEK